MLPGFGANFMAGLGIKNIVIGDHVSPKEDKFKDFERQKSYLLEADWKINKDNGGLVLISKEKKNNQGKIVKFVLKKFISTGSFMGISFPVFAMKPESILETYAKSISAAPLFFDGIEEDPTERLKKFVSFTFTFSRLFTDMDKPFNPTIGETYQTKIADGLFSAEQTSHHPPQSSFIYQGNGYRIHSTMELIADIGVNSAHGLFYGDITVEFNNGGKIIGRILSGEMSGFIVGENKFRPHGSSYAYDPINKIICTYQRDKKDNFIGEIGTLKEKYLNKFLNELKSKDRFSKFEAFKQKDFECIICHMEACWTKSVCFNKKEYLNFDTPNWLPFLPSQKEVNLLPSDSSFRRDIKLRGCNELKQSQDEKEQIEGLERFFRKLRSGDKNAKVEIKKSENLEEENEEV